MADAADIGLAFYEWAKSNGFLVNDDFDSPGSRRPLSALFPPKPETDLPDGSDQLLSRLMVTAVFHDESSNSVTICTKGAIPATRSKGLPHLIEGVTVHWIGSAQLQSNPPRLPLSRRPLSGLIGTTAELLAVARSTQLRSTGRAVSAAWFKIAQAASSVCQTTT
ncbi:hypothetical protein M6G65_18630 [Methylobacterium tardum]|uniref:hypothetical protein n=1 Tax=Methylobacterium tardum TaxID=374432 RepID=UPI002021E236|nr:hypothetical protein [Methylobacterium tardum]URD34613.1 hypothetical protein M6G65_18630 [Methylobacterium tardum]